ncbi:acetyl-CoA synthetase-like protein [Trametes coccinea BRFM310]|uniref:Acetyl-CoA synthetase-like protein n=1 Tax=Trametes coccinea (strain BRFM310) TaxID=1353009 RepID=A0A1Y2ILC5_TRAC3|nr:acetyl-CoA synthetase-like protein [Trametes coccinea BRFM310]
MNISTPQGNTSTTWVSPPFYGSMAIPELYAFHAEKSPTHPIFSYDDERGEPRELNYMQVFSAIRMAASYVSRHISRSVKASREGTGDYVLGVLAAAAPDHITLLTLYVGMMYIGHSVFPLSVRNSAVAVAHLARRTALQYIFVSHDPAMQRLAHEAKEILAKEGYEIDLLPLPEFRDLYNDSHDGLDIAMASQSEERTCLILHSSGSTSFPKPVPFSHRHFTRWGFHSSFGDYDLCGSHLSMHSLPLFHIMGCVSLTWAVCTGVVISLFRPSSPPITATPDTVLQAMVATKCEFIVCVPSILEAWSRNPEATEVLKKLKCIVQGGAGLNKEIGDKLVDQGINVVTGYGATEIGSVVRLMLDPTKRPQGDWEYFSLSPPVEFIRVYQDGLPRIFELVVVDSATWSPNVFNTIIDGRPAYATRDLLEEHPTDLNLYKVYGRVDDQIALSTGEKASYSTASIWVSAIVLQDPHVHAAIMFGQGREQNGILIQPREPFDPRDAEKLEEFRNTIWPTIERVNSFAPSHSRIFKEMITVTNPDKLFQYTAKGTPRRHVSLAEYAQEIDELYRRVEESSQVDIPPPSAWEGEALLQYVREVVKRVLKATQICDNDDLFQQGCDSLQATWIRNTILNAVRKTTMLSTHNIPLSFVYANPTIAALSAYLTGLVSGKVIDQRVQYAKRLEEMKELVAKYMKDWPAPQWKTATDGQAKPTSSGEIIVLTGSTGRVGSHLLSQMLLKPEVVRVYALNRESTGDAVKLADRQRKAFAMWGLKPELLSSDKVSLLPTDLKKPNFGLSEETYTEIQRSVTGILHNAWRVDFNVTLPSYEPLIAGTRNLLDFALNSPRPGGPAVLFVSSIASMSNYSSDVPVPEVLDMGPELAVGTGYGESKWVAEQICHRAAQDTGVNAIVVRVGQLCGDTKAGGWSTSEWVPAIVRASKLLGCLPATDDTLSWVPVDVAATTLLEFLHTASSEPVLHLASPRPAAWRDVFSVLADELGVPLVPASEWLDKLRKSAQDATINPANAPGDAHFSAHNLVPFFEAALARKEVKLGTERAVQVSSTLASMRPVSGEDAKGWVRFWRGVGFL